MAGNVSTAPAATAFLFTLFTNTVKNYPAPVGDESVVAVTYGEPGPYLSDDMVAVGTRIHRTEDSESMTGSGGVGARHERYRIEYVIDVFRGGDNPRAVQERAYTLLGGLEGAVRNDPSLGGLVLFSWPVSSDSNSQWEEAHKGRRTSITAEIECFAII